MNAVRGTVIGEHEASKVPLASKNSCQCKRVIGGPEGRLLQRHDFEALVGGHHRGRLALPDRVLIRRKIKLMGRLVIDDGRKLRVADSSTARAGLPVIQGVVFDLSHEAFTLDARYFLNP